MISIPGQLSSVDVTSTEGQSEAAMVGQWLSSYKKTLGTRGHLPTGELIVPWGLGPGVGDLGLRLSLGSEKEASVMAAEIGNQIKQPN